MLAVPMVLQWPTLVDQLCRAAMTGCLSVLPSNCCVLFDLLTRRPLRAATAACRYYPELALMPDRRKLDSQPLEDVNETYDGAEVETWRSISESVISPRDKAFLASHTTTPLPTSF